MPPLTKKRAKELSSERLRAACATQYGSCTTEDMAAPTGEVVREMIPPPPPVSIAETAPPLDEDEIDDVAPEDEEALSDGCSVRRGTKKSTGPPPKRRRGFGNLDKVKRIVKCTGKIEAVYDEFIRGPSSSSVNSLLVNSIGAIIRSKVKLSVGNWECLGDFEKKKLIDGLTPYFKIDFGDKRMWAWLEDKAGTIYRDWKGDFLRHYKKYGRGTIPPDLIHRRDEWDWLCWHFESADFKTRLAVNTTNRGKKESEHHTGRLPIIYRVVHHKEKGEEFLVIPAYTESCDTINDPKAAKNLKEASKLKNEQKNANPDVPKGELPPLKWSINIKVLEAGVGRRSGKEIRGLGREGVRESSSSAPHSRVYEVEDRLHTAEERAEKAEAVAQNLSQEMALVKQQLAAVMSFMAQQTGCPPQVPSQQPLNENVDVGNNMEVERN